jgi:hypothetical protein
MTTPVMSMCNSPQVPRRNKKEWRIGNKKAPASVTGAEGKGTYSIK